MKKAVPFLITLTALNVFAQESANLVPSRSLFKLSPQHFTQNALKIGIERFNRNFTKSVAFYLTGMLGDNTSNNDYYNTYGYNGLSGEFQFRKYIRPMELLPGKRGNEYVQGIYFAGFLQGGSYSANRYSDYYTIDPNTGVKIKVVEYDYDESIGNIAFGFTLGWHRTLWKVVYVDLYIGGGLQFSDVIRTGQLPQYYSNYYFYYRDAATDPGYQGILPKFGVQIGIGL